MIAWCPRGSVYERPSRAMRRAGPCRADSGFPEEQAVIEANASVSLIYSVTFLHDAEQTIVVARGAVVAVEAKIRAMRSCLASTLFGPQGDSTGHRRTGYTAWTNTYAR